uniref:Hyaluronan/mRNA-binding protein domain-containing protein n=1 Tax=Parascaris univalens TaxID=6257 RepID=A0A915B1J1_PARUN
GGRGGGFVRPMEGEQDQNTDDTNALLVNGDQNTEFVGGFGGGYRGGYRGGRGGYRGGDGERFPFRGGRGGRGRQFERISGSDRA